ncbi:MAG: class I SAM-dependent methyltransferase, partial [Flavobacteriales bacterium]
TWDFVFVDGNHRKEATLEAVELLAPHLGEGAVVVIDDIYWSRGMTEAWDELRKREQFALSIDVFEMGILFMGLPMAKQHFVLRY